MPRDGQPERHVVERVEMPEQHLVLEHHADAPLLRAERRHRRAGSSRTLPASRTLPPSSGSSPAIAATIVDLAGAIGSEQGSGLACFDAQRHVQLELAAPQPDVGLQSADCRAGVVEAHRLGHQRSRQGDQQTQRQCDKHQADSHRRIPVRLQRHKHRQRQRLGPPAETACKRDGRAELAEGLRAHATTTATPSAGPIIGSVNPPQHPQPRGTQRGGCVLVATVEIPQGTLDRQDHKRGGHKGVRQDDAPDRVRQQQAGGVMQRPARPRPDARARTAARRRPRPAAAPSAASPAPVSPSGPGMTPARAPMRAARRPARQPPQQRSMTPPRARQRPPRTGSTSVSTDRSTAHAQQGPRAAARTARHRYRRAARPATAAGHAPSSRAPLSPLLGVAVDASVMALRIRNRRMRRVLCPSAGMR